MPTRGLGFGCCRILHGKNVRMSMVQRRVPFVVPSLLDTGPGGRVSLDSERSPCAGRGAGLRLDASLQMLRMALSYRVLHRSARSPAVSRDELLCFT